MIYFLHQSGGGGGGGFLQEKSPSSWIWHFPFHCYKQPNKLFFPGFSSFVAWWSIEVKRNTMKFVFAIQLISVLLMFQPDTCLSLFTPCDVADWEDSLDHQGWSVCPKRNTYLKGLYRSEREPGDERLGRIEYGECCPASESAYVNQPETCSNANWEFILSWWAIRIITPHPHPPPPTPAPLTRENLGHLWSAKPSLISPPE